MGGELRPRPRPALSVVPDSGPPMGAPALVPAPPVASCAPRPRPHRQGPSLLQAPAAVASSLLRPKQTSGLYQNLALPLGFSFHARSRALSGVPSTHLTSTLPLLSPVQAERPGFS